MVKQLILKYQNKDVAKTIAWESALNSYKPNESKVLEYLKGLKNNEIIYRLANIPYVPLEIRENIKKYLGGKRKSKRNKRKTKSKRKSKSKNKRKSNLKK